MPWSPTGTATFLKNLPYRRRGRREISNRAKAALGGRNGRLTCDAQILPRTTTIRNANKIYQTTTQKAEHNKQVAINNARSTLQGTGDVGPA
jgi:hypothetical protein